MPKRPPQRDPTPEPQPVRDLDLCKAVFSAAVSQILYARRAFPPECFQLVPLSDLLVAPFEDIAASGGNSVQSHDREVLRDQRSTLFLQQGSDYGVNRFLGILRNDILPLIDHEGLVKFRINFLRAPTWDEKALVEYYTVALKYLPGGAHELDVWRAGTGRQHIATTDSQLWNLGDYLSRLPAWTEPMNWTLAFHATERPDDPPIGVWKFDRTDFDDANLDLQQRRGYTYARIARLQIEPLPPADTQDAVSETSCDTASEISLQKELRARISSPALRKEPREKISSPVPQGKGQAKAGKKIQGGRTSRKGNSGDRGQEPAAATQLSPPPTLVSSRNTSKNTTASKRVSKSPESPDNSGTQKVTKRKPKRPLQLFETAASSLPPTQIIDESQTLSHKPFDRNQQPNMHRPDPALPAARSSSPDPMKLLDGISLSPSPRSPSLGLPPLPTSLPQTQLERRQATPAAEFRGILRLGPSSSVYGGMPGMGMSQWERASPARGFLGIEVSDGVEGEGEGQVGGRMMIEGGGERGREGDGSFEEAMAFDFEGNGAEGDDAGNLVQRRKSLFYDSSCGSGAE